MVRAINASTFNKRKNLMASINDFTAIVVLLKAILSLIETILRLKRLF